ncbi:MAG: exosortase/archaeosortase family protein [Chitinophagaceae bacterium]|nr:exosortase/archaeosortase family protein [Chitinophagaceae bacterium]
MISKLIKKYPEASFILKTILLYCLFNYGSKFWIGITAKGNFYSEFCDQHLNYIKWLRHSILIGASFVCKMFGFSTQIIDTTIIRVENGYGVTMIYSCIGISVLSSWTAVALAYTTPIKRKLIWLFSGLAVIWIINVLRVAILLILFNTYKNPKGFEYHHEVFNTIAYIFVLVMIYFYLKDKKLTLKQ